MNCPTRLRADIYECLLRNIEEIEDFEEVSLFIIDHYEREENHNIRDNDKCTKKHSKVS